MEEYWALSGTYNIRNNRTFPREIAVPDLRAICVLLGLLPFLVEFMRVRFLTTTVNVMLSYYKWFHLYSVEVGFSPYPIVLFLGSPKGLEKKSIPSMYYSLGFF